METSNDNQRLTMWISMKGMIASSKKEDEDEDAHFTSSNIGLKNRYARYKIQVFWKFKHFSFTALGI